jgi:hypothetical protein
MANIDFDSVLNTLKDEVTSLAVTTFKNYKKEVKKDGLAILDDLKDNLKNWTLQLSNGALSKDDFEFLVLAQKDLLKINALKRAGISLVEADKFKAKLLGIVVNTIVGLI